jgi:hypothetical protein
LKEAEPLKVPSLCIVPVYVRTFCVPCAVSVAVRLAAVPCSVNVHGPVLRTGSEHVSVTLAIETLYVPTKFGVPEPGLVGL